MLICYKARGKMPGWKDRHGLDLWPRKHLLLRGRAGALRLRFTEPGPEPCFDNAFNHSVDEIMPDGSRVRKLGGAQSVVAANALC